MNKYYCNKLDNNLKYILIENKCIETCSIIISVNVGSVNEKNFEPGISHFLEHMVFKGTNKYKEIDLIEEFEKKGIIFNASTDKDVTKYYAKTNQKYIDSCLDLFTEMLFKSIFPPGEFRKEKNVVIEEYNKDYDDASEYIDELLTPKIFSKNVMGNSIIGTKKSILSIKRKDLIEYYNKYYNPNNMQIAIVGKFNKNKTEQLIKKYFSIENKNNIYETIVPFISNQNKINKIISFRKTAQTHLLIAFPIFADRHKHYNALNIGINIFGSGMSSRLFSVVREKYGLVYSISCDLNIYKYGGLISITAGLDSKNLKPTLDLIIKEINKIKKNGFTICEVKKAKINIETELFIMNEDTDSLADYYVNELNFNKIITLKNLINKNNKVTLDEINQVFNLYFDFKKMNIGIIGNIKKKTQKK